MFRRPPRSTLFPYTSSSDLGAVVHVARRIADELPEGSNVVAVLADGGWKYLSAEFWRAEDVEERSESTRLNSRQLGNSDALLWLEKKKGVQGCRRPGRARDE